MRYAAVTRRLAISLLAVVAAGPPEREGLPRRSPCPASRWAPPQTISGKVGPRAVVARWPSLAFGPRGAFVVGVDIPHFDATFVPRAPLTAWRVGGSSLGKPKGLFGFVFPKAVVAADGRLHVVWAESDNGSERVPALDWPAVPLTSLWSAMYAEGKGWSPPVLVVRGYEFGWEDAQVFRSDNGDVVITAPGQTNEMRTRGAVLLRLHGDTWRVSPVLTTSSIISYPTLAADGDRLYLGFIAPSPVSGGQDRNSVFVQWSTDGGVTWSKSSLVSRSGMEPAYDLRALVGKGGHLHLVWHQELASGRTSLRHIESADGATTWGSIDSLTVGDMAAPHAVFDACGVLHVVFEGWSSNGEIGQLYHTTWTGRWSSPEQPFADRSVTSHDLQRGPGGEPTLVFLQWPKGVAPSRRPETAYSILR